jgi:hypothetical protein
MDVQIRRCCRIHHSCAQFVPAQQNLVVTGGKDKTLRVWRKTDDDAEYDVSRFLLLDLVNRTTAHPRRLTPHLCTAVFTYWEILSGKQKG